MAGKTTKDCLLKAVDTLFVRGADPDEMGKIRRRLKNQINSSTQDDVALVNSLQHQADIIRHQLVADRLAEAGFETKMLEFSSGRFDTESRGTARQKFEAARAFRREVSAEAGNRGSREEATLDSAITFEIGMLGGKLAKVIQYVTKTGAILEDSEMALPWLKEVIGIDTGNADAAGFAKVFHDTMFQYLNRLRNANVWVEKVENWFPQTHDWARIQSNFDEWKRFLIKHLDPEKHPDRESAIEALQSAVSQQEFAGDTPGRLGLGRTFWFDTPEAQLEYQMKFGRGNVTGTILSIVHRMASEVAMAEKFGPKPSKLLTERAKRMKEDIANFPAKTKRDEKFKARAQRQLERAENLVKYQQQQMSTPTIRDLENIGTFLKEAFSGIYLGKVTGSIVTEDVWNGVWQGRHLSGGFMQSAQDRFSTFAAIVGDTGNAREVAEGMGWYQQALLANGGVNRYTLGSGPDAPLDVASGSATERLAALGQQGRIFTNRFTAASVSEQGLRGANGLGNQRGLGRLIKQDWDQVDRRVRNLVLKSNGITAKDWEILQKVGAGPEGVAFDLRKLESQNVKLFRKVGAMLTRESHLQTIMPDLETRFLLSGQIPAGTPRVAATLMTQFLSWPTAIWRNSIARDLRAGKPSFMIGAGGYVAMTAFKIQLYALAAGGIANTFRWDSPELWYRATLQSAVMGPFIPMLAEGVMGGELELPGIVPNRIVGSGAQMVRAGKSWMDGETDEAAAKVTREMGNFVPNWWFIDGVTNHVIESVTADLDPAAARRAERRKEREGRRGE